MIFLSIYLIPALILIAFALLGMSIRILREYERAVVFTSGKFDRVRGPGLVLLIPFVQQMVRVDLRIQVIEIPSQDVISRDNVSMKVDAVLYFNVVDPERAIIQVQRYLPATNMLAQTTLRAVLGQHELDEMLSERKKLSTDVQSILDTQTESLGHQGHQRRDPDRRADGQHGARHRQAGGGGARPPGQDHPRGGRVPGVADARQRGQDPVEHPAAMQLRYLQTLTEIGAEQNSTVVFPMPIDIIRPFMDIVDKVAKPAAKNGALIASPAMGADVALSNGNASHDG